MLSAIVIWVGMSSLMVVNGCSLSTSRLYSTEEDRAIFQSYLSFMAGKEELPIAERIIETAHFFLETPYVAATLEKEPEGLVVNLREMDCTTFVENVLALSRILHRPSPSFEDFCKELQSIRYRNGEISDYTDRLHYMTDWIYENVRQGRVKDITAEVGGVRLPLQLSFMSTHSDAYKPLKGNVARVRKIAEQEKIISRRTYYYLPQDSIEYHASSFRNGDIVCFVTSIAGLDVAHVGYVCHKAGNLTFIHASSTGKKVIINDVSLSNYVKSIKKDIGILLIRPLPVD